MSLLNQLPDTLDWRLHIVALTQKTFSGEAVRKARTADQKRLLASALCQEAEKIGATGGCLGCCFCTSAVAESGFSCKLSRYAPVCLTLCPSLPGRFHRGV